MMRLAVWLVMVGQFHFVVAQDGSDDKNCVETYFSCPLGIGVGLVSPAFERGLIIPRVPLDLTATEVWNNVYSNMGNYPVGLLVEVSHVNGNRMSYAIGGSYAPSRLRTHGFASPTQTTPVREFRWYGKALWWRRPSISNSSVRLVLGALYVGEWDDINAANVEGTWCFHQTATTHSFNAVVGGYLGRLRTLVGMEAELLLVSYSKGDWRRTFFDGAGNYAFDYSGSYSQWLELTTALPYGYLLRTVTFRVIWKIPISHA